MYGDTGLQQYKLEPRMWCSQWGTTFWHCWSAGLLFQSLRNARKLLLSKICTLGKLLHVMPATNAVIECSFSTLKRVKTYLRSTTGQAGLNHFMLLHVHKEVADGMDKVEVANLFVGDNHRRRSPNTTFRWSLCLPLGQRKQTKITTKLLLRLCRWTIFLF